MVLPQFLSMIVVGIMWKMLFMVDGPVARIMQAMSGDPTKQFTLMWIQTAMIPVGIALIWVYTGFYMIIFLRTYKINDKYIEAANRWSNRNTNLYTYYCSSLHQRS